MSADNWAICPNCKKADWRVALGQDEELPHTLREDYEQGMSEDGEYFVSYRCSCIACNWRWEYRHTEQALTGGAK